MPRCILIVVKKIWSLTVAADVSRSTCRGQRGRDSHAEDGGSPRAPPRGPGRLLQSVHPRTFFPAHNGHAATLVCSARARSSSANIGGERQRERLRLAARVVE